MTVYQVFILPFVEYGFLRRALIACVALGLGSVPVGVLLMLRRMSLVGDAMIRDTRQYGRKVTNSPCTTAGRTTSVTSRPNATSAISGRMRER
ncbi:metal ABC transporter permease [Bradyrhizobium sp. CNPSo 4026]|nr:metal ABC transporter permease [Bradyrhizobium cenepequi]